MFLGNSAARTRFGISRSLPPVADGLVIRALDVAIAVGLLMLLVPVIVTVAGAIKLESRGPVFYRARRVGLHGREFAMLKFRKMRADASGPRLTSPLDDRFTRIGRFLAKTKLDEVPQLWNVLRGQMSLVGPRPEDPVYFRKVEVELGPVLSVKPGITGLSQLAFAREPEILDPSDREGHYIGRILPQKIHMDSLYAEQRSATTNMRILYWTAAAVILRRDVAVNRMTGRLGVRRRPVVAGAPAAPDSRRRAVAVSAEQAG